MDIINIACLQIIVVFVLIYDNLQTVTTEAGDCTCAGYT